MIGEKLLHYEITDRLGEGGMGVVYRATDTRLNREVAIKVLPEAFVEDTERLARFHREAKLLASLNHPNIGGIHGLEESGPHRFLVLELIEGETLAERLASGSIPAGEALPIALQIAEALQAAHARGIVHRDLKPSNIKLAPGGPSGPTVKVLDFGLAKAWDQPAGTPDLTGSPTLTAQRTQAGVILGTASYMSPEQARAQEADKRADIWSFGVVLFEMLAGARIFGGDTVTDILGAIVHKEPDWRLLPPNLAAGVKRLLKRCLTKDREHRLQDIGDARIEIEDALETDAEPRTRRVGIWEPGIARWLPWAVATVAVVAAAWALVRRPPEVVAGPEPVGRYSVVLPEEQTLYREGQSVAISPDGRQIAYSASLGGERRIFLRSRESFDVTPIAGSEGGGYVFYSPNGQWIGFTKAGELQKVAVKGGTPVTVSRGAAGPYGASWGDDETIVFAGTWGVGLSRVSATGGVPEQLTEPDRQSGEGAHLWPEILPGSETVLYTSWTSAGGGKTSIIALSVATGENKLLLGNARIPRYSKTGHLLFMRGGTLMAVPFDADRVEVEGEPVPLEDDVRRISGSYGAVFDISAEGRLVYQGGGEWEARREMVWVDREGKAMPALDDHRDFIRPDLSPDGQRIAITVRGPVFNIWIYDLAAGTRAQLTREADNGGPVWMPNGKEIVYWSNLGGPYGVYRIAVDGSSSPTLLSEVEGEVGNATVSPDGRTVIYENTPPRRSTDLLLLNLEQGQEQGVFAGSEGNEQEPAFSPDGRWVAFMSDESGRDEIYVAPYPGPGPSWLVSSGGGVQPEWSPDGSELYYWQGDKLMAVAVESADQLHLGKAQLLFRSEQIVDQYTVAPDGRFLMVRQLFEEGPEKHQLNLVLNWTSELAN